ncbi:hemocyanin F chain [Trichonephila inaurata madagascariensis]|uniref:Hemocyanin F chain n=1 Tax=Trichonephila inaurata madagascariensis TaxID=2747483 RepID=A0A8X7CNR1_9ARAC|nr:hemocyanin F chain [Trichonephila inaurata madagascariensis]
MTQWRFFIEKTAEVLLGLPFKRFFRIDSNKENLGVTSTSLRDPIFYRYHKFLDNIFQEYKKTLKPYDKTQLDFSGVQVVNNQINAKPLNNVYEN